MDLEGLHDIDLEGVSPPDLDNVSSAFPPPPIAVLPALLVAACGDGGTTAATSSAATPALAAAPAPPPPPPPTATQASRFLAQAAMGSTDADIQAVVSLGYDGWLNAQFGKARAPTFWDWLVANGYTAIINMFRQDGLDPMAWSQLITAEDQLRQRVGTALMSFLVVGIDSTHARWQQFSMAAYMDILWDNAFGNYRTILEKISLSPVMGWSLTFANSKKASPSGAVPDENYAREIMQLFTIGLYQLNLDGSQKLSNGKPIETYKISDVTGLARVFTGWVYTSFAAETTPDPLRLQMTQNAAEHELDVKTFLGTTIPAGTDGMTSLKLALDALFAHPNVAPFVSKQMIQRLVTSNPSPAYIQRVATIFENNGSGVRGDMKAVVRAILLDADARNDAAAAASTTFGKVREPMIRFTNWARAFGASSPSNAWAIDARESFPRLAEGLGRSPSVFNFFRPEYAPPNTAIATQAMVGPEFQITNEITVVGYLNFLLLSMRDGWGDFKGNYTEYLAKAADSQALLDMINLRVAANQVSAATIAQIKTAVDSIASSTADDLQNRVFTATLLIMSSPEYIILK